MMTILVVLDNLRLLAPGKCHQKHSVCHWCTMPASVDLQDPDPAMCILFCFFCGGRKPIRWMDGNGRKGEFGVKKHSSFLPPPSSFKPHTISFAACSAGQVGQGKRLGARVGGVDVGSSQVPHGDDARVRRGEQQRVACVKDEASDAGVGAHADGAMRAPMPAVPAVFHRRRSCVPEPHGTVASTAGKAARAAMAISHALDAGNVSGKQLNNIHTQKKKHEQTKTNNKKKTSNAP